jgi:cytochrome c oxidase cbb3-type subunit 3
MENRRRYGIGGTARTLVWVVAGFGIVSWLFTAGLDYGTVSAADSSAAVKMMKNPFIGNTDAVKEGGKTFDERCSECHGGDAMGMSGPDLTDDRWLYGGSDSEVFQTVSKGRPGGMPSWSGTLKDDEIWKVVAYIKSLNK